MVEPKRRQPVQETLQSVSVPSNTRIQLERGLGVACHHRVESATKQHGSCDGGDKNGDSFQGKGRQEQKARQLLS
jgi:hypothetical protein